MTLETRKLSKKIKDHIILNNINITFESGNIYGIVGKNGCGKTMLLRAISGLIVPTGGEVIVDGKKLHKDLSFSPELGILIEKPEFIGYMSGLDNLCLLADINKKVTKDEIASLMKTFDLEPNSKNM